MFTEVRKERTWEKKSRVGFVSYGPLGASSFQSRKVIAQSTNQIK